jgi:polar amino acid transport system substrate-binding protein
VIGKDVQVERLDRLLAGAGHSLRTPLNSVLGFTEVLLMELPGSLNEEQRRLLHNVRSGALQMDMTIDDLLDLVRIETGMMELRLESVDIGAVVDDVRSELQPSADEKGLSLEVEIPPGMTCFTNGRAISRILVNLIGNAISFTDAGGVQILGVVSDGVGAARVDIIDTGIGFPESEHARLFEPFERGPAPEGDTRGGAGLGLQVSCRLADLLGTEIVVQGRPGRGSRFSLILPRRE